MKVMVKRKIKEIMQRFFLEKLTHRDYNFQVQEDDIFIISYPKSGNTWMRFLLANLLTDKEVDFHNLEDIIVDIYKKSDKEIKKTDNLRIFKSHSFFRPKFSNNKVIYIVRDVRDVVVSYYYYYKKTAKNDIDFNIFFKKFMRGQIDNYGTWGENVGSWLGAKIKDNNFLLIKYENMLEDTHNEFKKVCDFLDLDFSKDKLEEAIEKSSFENLRKKEVKVENKAVELKNSSKDIKFFRKGQSGQWNDLLSQSQLKEINSNFGSLLNKLGYIK